MTTDTDELPAGAEPARTPEQTAVLHALRIRYQRSNHILNAALLRYLLPASVGRRRGTLVRIAAAVLALSTLITGLYYRPATARAASSTCTDSLGHTIPCPPPPLLDGALLKQPGGLYAATAAQRQSLATLEQQAVTNTIQDHQLAAGDTAAVQTWGQDDAEAELWHLLVSAVQTEPTSRTTDQQNAVDWLTALQLRENVQAAQDAGLEYVKWAGLDQKYYQSLVSSGASESTLETFLKGTPVNYNLIDSSGNPITLNPGTSPGSFDYLTAAGKSTGGYCVYRSPAGDTSTVYKSNIFNSFSGADQTCFTPCPVANCPVLPPSYGNFVEWGATDAADKDFSTDDHGVRAQNIGIGTGFGLLAGAAVAGIALGSTLLASGATATAGAAATFILPFAASFAATAGAVVALVVIVVVAIVVAAIFSYQLFNALKLPGQLASLVAPTTAPTVDLNAILKDTSQSTGLFNLFVGATLPTPKSATCDNTTLLSSEVPCLNAPSVPALANDDPGFAIQQQGATTWTDASSISWKDTKQNTSTTGRLSGDWFVDQVNDTTANTTSTVQTLRIQYTDWSGNEKVAWLLNLPTSGPTFVGFTDGAASGTPLVPSTCRTDGTCFQGPTIEYQGTDGKNYTAKVVPTRPLIAPTASANPLEGSPVTFHANGSSPVGSSLTYQWTFEMPAGPSTCLVNCSGPPTVSASGATVSNTWTTSGTFHVQLTATDAQGRQTVDTFPVSVGEVAPTMALAPACPGASPCDVRSGTPRSAATLTGSITHAGSADTETVDINWGDSTADNTTTVPQTGSVIVPCVNGVCPTTNPSITTASGTLYTFSGTHAYAHPGTYNAKVTVTDQAGATVSQTVVETVQKATLTITASSATILPGHLFPSITPSYSGFLPGDSPSSLTTLPTCGTTATPSSAPGFYTTSCSGAVSTDYTFVYDPGTLAIEQVASAPGDLTCSPSAILTGTVGQDLIVDGTVCRVAHVHVVRDVIVKNGGSLIGDVVTGRNLQVQGAAQISLTGGDVGQDAIIQATTGGPDTLSGVWVGRDLTIQSSGAPAAWQIHNNTIMGSALISNNLGSIDFEANRLTRTAGFQSNTGGVIVLNNHYSSLSCTGDVPAATGQCTG
jgi:hypothetical protein